MPYPNPADLDAIRKDPKVTVLEQAGLNVGYLAYNTQKKPFDDVRVRKAVNMAIDKQAIIKAVYLSAGVAATNPIPPPPRSCWPTPATPTASPPICGRCRCSGRTTPTRGALRSSCRPTSRRWA